MKDRNNSCLVYLVFSNILNFRGGEQVYGIFLLQALYDFHWNVSSVVFLRREKSIDLCYQFWPKTQFYCFGKLPRILQIFILIIKFMLLGILQRPKLIISSHVNYAPLCYLLNCFIGSPYCIIAHGLEIWNLRGFLRKIALHNAKHVIAVSDYTRDLLIKEQKLDPHKISVLPATFDAEQFYIKPKPQYLLKRYGLRKDQPVILTVTRMTPYKGYDQIIQALPEICHSIPEVHYLLAGKGGDSFRIQALVNELNLQERVTLTGFIPDDELCDHYNLCDVFAMPSCGEGFGIVFLEALACGKPVLAGNSDGSTAPLLQGKLGCLVNPNDIDQISKTLVQILSGTYENPLIYQPESLREKAVEEFGLSRFSQSLAELISTWTSGGT